LERLAFALIVLREKCKDENADRNEITLNISRIDLANIAGIAQENVTRLLKEFKDEGILETAGRKIWIKNVTLLIKKSNYR
ncbi:MAG: helix-turn-helix domain-containing protein, partial [Daejeonella sp.]